MAAAVVLGCDLDVERVEVVIIPLAVLDAQVGEVDLLVEVRQVMVMSPALDLFVGAVGAAVAVTVTAIAPLQEPLVLGLQVAIELHAHDAGVPLPEPLGFAHVGAVDLGVVASLARLVGPAVEGLAPIGVAVPAGIAAVAFEEIVAALRQGDGMVAPVERDAFKESLVAEVAQVTVGPTFITPRVA